MPAASWYLQAGPAPARPAAGAGGACDRDHRGDGARPGRRGPQRAAAVGRRRRAGALPRDVADAMRQAMEPAALSLCSDLLHALEAVLDPSGRMVSAVQRPGAMSGSDRCVARAAA